MAPLPPHTRARGPRGLLIALLLSLALVLVSPPRAFSDDNVLPGAGYEQRASAEKVSRTRYRKLEVASIVLILVSGGAAILWAVRRK